MYVSVNKYVHIFFCKCVRDSKRERLSMIFLCIACDMSVEKILKFVATLF